MTLRPLFDRIAVWLARLLMRLFYRRIERIGLENVPQHGPLLFVANHPNSLVDPMLLLGTLPRVPRFLAKHTLFSHPLVRPLLALAGSLPVYRRHEAGDATGRNAATFARCHEALAAGSCVALFPEGLSHDEPALQRLKTGAARIALGAEAQHGPLGLRIVPVGLAFEDKGRFRSRVLVVVGAPLDPARARAEHAGDERAAVRALTAQIDAALHAVTDNHASHERARLLARAASVLHEEQRALPGLPPLARHFTLRRGLAGATARLAERRPAQAARLEALLARYDALLARHALRDDQVAASWPWRAVAVQLLDRLPLLLLWVPAALLGALLNGAPALAARLAGRRIAHERTLPATHKLMTGLFAFPIWWTALGVLAGLAWGAPAGLLVAALAPASGFCALRFREEHQRLLAETRAWLALRLFAEHARELRALRRVLRCELVAVTGALPRETRACRCGRAAGGGPSRMPRRPAQRAGVR